MTPKAIIGTGEFGSRAFDKIEKDAVYQTNSSYWNEAGSDFLGTIALPLYGAFVSEEKLQLLGEVSEKKVLEIGCGDGQSLQYMGKRHTAELWGLDISRSQLEKAEKRLTANGMSAKLICSPMEEECGIPVEYFDLVYSVYAMGWAVDLERAFRRVASYLKPGGVFVFSWSHPLHKCVAMENERLVFQKSYFDESWYSVPLEKGTITLSDRKLSTYINALSAAGFFLERLEEESDPEMTAGDDEFAQKARILPVTFVIRARKR